MFPFRRVHQFESFAHFEMSLIVDAFVMSLVDEHRRKTIPLLVAKCAECSMKKELGKENHPSISEKITGGFRSRLSGMRTSDLFGMYFPASISR